MFPMLLEIFLPCFFGNELTEASSKLSSFVFNSNWIEMNKKYRRIMQFFVESTKQEMKISAFRIFDANMATFKKVITAAASYYAGLTTYVANKKDNI
jgi:predicted kinase